MKKNVSESPKIMTASQLASYLQMQDRTIYKLAKKGKIPAMKIGAEWRFKKDLIDSWMEEKSLENVKK